MKKIFLFLITIITTFSLTACSNSNEDHLRDYIADELHQYVFNYSYNWETNEYNYLDTINNDVATSVIMLSNYIPIDLESLLEQSGSSVEEVTTTYEEMEITDVSTAFNMILVYKMLGLDLDDLKTWAGNLTLNYIDSTKGYYGVVYPQTYLTVINCLNMLNMNASLKTTLIEKFDDFDVVSSSYMDADLASMIVISLQGTAHKDYLDYIYSSITFGGVKNWSDELSCSSTSQVLMALMSQGIVYNNNSVIRNVLSFKTTNGFKEYLDDTTADFSYASPQAFLAITTAYLFEETSNKVLFY